MSSRFWRFGANFASFGLLAVLTASAAAAAPTTQPVGKSFEGHQAEVSSVVFSADGKSIVSGDDDGVIRQWDAASGKPGWRVATMAGRIYGLASKDGRFAAACRDGTVRMFDEAGKQLYKVDAHDDRAYTAAFSPDGTLFASGGKDAVIRLWSAKDGAALRPGPGPEPAQSDQVRGVLFMPDGTSLLSLGRDGTIGLWSVPDLKSRATFQTGHEDRVYGLSLSTDGKTLATVSKDKSVRLFDVATHTHVKVLSGPAERLGCVAWLRKGDLIAAGGRDNLVTIWDAKTSKIVTTLNGPEAAVAELTLSPDGKQIAAACADQRVWVWDIANIGRR